MTIRQIRQQTIKDINKDRKTRKIKRLKPNQRLDQVAKIRSQQIKRHFSHNTPTYRNVALKLIKKRHLRYQSWGENIASAPLGTTDDVQVGEYKNSHDYRNNHFKSRTKNGIQLANNLNRITIYHDRSDHNGHRNNDLNPNYTKIGVGAAYNPQNQNFTVAVEFLQN